MFKTPAGIKTKETKTHRPYVSMRGSRSPVPDHKFLSE